MARGRAAELTDNPSRPTAGPPLHLDDRALSSWCAGALGSPVASMRFRTGHLAQVVGADLEDGRAVVVKVRPWHPRLVGCTEVQRRLHAGGFPAPMPMAGPTHVAGLAISAEQLIDVDELPPPDDAAARRYAAALASLVGRATTPATSLDPTPPWADWTGATAAGRLWPAADDLETDLNQEPASYLDEVAAAVRELALARPRHGVVGHLDFYDANTGWRDGLLVAVFDWDSVAVEAEPAVAGQAAATWPGGTASVEQTAAFLSAYLEARGRQWTDQDHADAWAAGLWGRAYDAKKLAAQGLDPGRVLTAAEADERLARAGLPPLRR